MRKATAIWLSLVFLMGSGFASHPYRYGSGFYYSPPGVRFAHGGYYRGLYSGYSPSFSFGVYRPPAYYPLSCDYVAGPIPYRGVRGAFLGAGTYPVVLSLPVGSEVVRANFSDMIFNVTPSTALVYIDGKLIGSARSFATERDRYMVMEGEHDLRIESPGHETFEAVLDVIPNRTLRIDVDMKKLPGKDKGR